MAIKNYKQHNTAMFVDSNGDVRSIIDVINPTAVPIATGHHTYKEPNTAMFVDDNGNVYNLFDVLAGGGSGGGGTGGLTIDSITGLRNILDSKATGLQLDSLLEKIQLVSENGNVLSEIALMTEQQVQDIKNLFV